MVNSLSSANFEQSTKQIYTTKNNSAFKRWVKGEDKYCTDGKDDGKISFGEKFKHFGKGLCGIVRTIINHPIATTTAIATGIGLTLLSGGTVLPVLVAFGAIVGASEIAIGTYKAAKAKTDAQAQKAWDTMGYGTFSFLLSFFTAKSALHAAKAGGMNIAETAKEGGNLTATYNCLKFIPKALKVSYNNSKINIALMLKKIKALIHPSHDVVSGAKGLKDAIPMIGRSARNATAEEAIAANAKLAAEAKAPRTAILNDEIIANNARLAAESKIPRTGLAAEELLNATNDTIRPAADLGQAAEIARQSTMYKVTPIGTKAQPPSGSQAVAESELFNPNIAGNANLTSLPEIQKQEVINRYLRQKDL
ncbi:MAG: hypothetical protein PHX18_01470 [Candidatus Gastranaerophilales bacterium]|nr:hypothetical protein [Candidatus Gastranaerophilales bacterium]